MCRCIRNASKGATEYLNGPLVGINTSANVKMTDPLLNKI